MKPRIHPLFSVLLSFISALFLAVVVTPQLAPAVQIQPLGFAVLWLLLNVLFVRVPKGTLAELTITDTSYAGKLLDQWIAYATTSFDTLLKGCINVLPGIKKKATVPVIKVDSFIQAHQETPVHGGNIDVEGRTLVTQDFMGYLEFNPRKFEQHWEAVKMNPKLLDAMLPKTAASAIIQQILKGNNAYMDKVVWQGDKDDAAIVTAKTNGLGPGDNNLIFMDGFQKKMYQDGDVKKVGAPVALTPANIFDKFGLVAQELPTEVYDDPNFKFLLAGANKATYGDAQKAQTYKGADKTQAGRFEFDGKPVVVINGMSPHTIVGGKATRDINSNLWMGVNEIDEEMYLKLMQLANNSELWFIKMLFKIDVNYGLPEELSLYMTEAYD